MLNAKIFLFLIVIIDVELGDSATWKQQVTLSAAARCNAGGWNVTVSAATRVTPRPGPAIGLHAKLSTDDDDGTHDSTWATLTLEAHVLTPGHGYERSTFGPAHANSLYRMHVRALPWMEAANSCRSEGAHLLVINSDEEALVVADFFSRKPKFLGAVNDAWFYVGFRAFGGRNLTVLGTDVKTTGYVRWAPDGWGMGSDYCGIIDQRVLLGFDDCRHARPYICEVEI